MKHLSTIFGTIALTALVACGGETDAGMDEMDDEMAPSSEMMADTMTTDSMAVDSMEQGMPDEMMDEGMREDMESEMSSGMDDDEMGEGMGGEGEMGGGV